VTSQDEILMPDISGYIQERVNLPEYALQDTSGVVLKGIKDCPVCKTRKAKKKEVN